MVRRGGERAVVGRERVLLAAERAQRIAAVVERERMPRRDGERRVVVRERLPASFIAARALPRLISAWT